jgi:hypothetical protein
MKWLTFIIVKIKYIQNNLAKKMKDLYHEDYTAMKKEIEEESRKKMKDLPCSWIRITNIVKILYYPKQFMDQMEFPPK